MPSVAGRGDHDVVARRPTPRRRRSTASVRAAPGTVAAAARDGDHLGPERLQQRDQRAADPARADDQPPSRPRASARRWRPSSSHERARAKRVERLVGGQHQRQRVLGDRQAEGAGGRRDRSRSPSTVPDAQPLLDAGRRELHPAHASPGRSGSSSGSPPSHTSPSAPSSGPSPPAAVLDGGARGRGGRRRDVDDGWLGHGSCGLPALSRLSRRDDARDAMAIVPLLSARGLVKSFGGRRILDGLDLELADGARIGVLGPNGGGKSTLLRILAGLEHPDAGDGHAPPRAGARLPAAGGRGRRAHAARHRARRAPRGRRARGRAARRRAPARRPAPGRRPATR